MKPIAIRSLLPRKLITLLFVLCVCVASNAQAAGDALLMQIDSAIGPATADYIHSGIQQAELQGSSIVIIELDTPGGLDSAMRDIIKDILTANIPVATFVSPSGSRAASAGTYILYASQIAAMTPASNLGAATPVQIGASPAAPTDSKPAGEPAEDPASSKPDAMKAKMVNDSVAYIKGLAELRGRNAEWAEQAVRDAVSLTATAALEANVIDIVAADVNDLLQQMDGREVSVAGEPVQLLTAGLSTELFEANWRIQLLTIITDPSVAYLLMLIGIYGLLLEGYNPGGFVPGIVGAICLLLALFAFQVIPVNYAGLALMLLGIMLMVAEGFAPSFGVLGIGGLAAFVFGSVILMDSDVPGFAISTGIIGGTAVAGGLAMLGLIYMFMRARNQPVVTGKEKLIGEFAEALEDFEGRGHVFLDGERWMADAVSAVSKGQKLQVNAIDGLVLKVSIPQK